MGLFSASSKSCLGIDIGTSSIKMVELIKSGGKAKLVSYGFSENASGKLANDWQVNIEKTAAAINKIHRESGMSSRDAISALPTFSVFSSVLNLAKVDKKDMAAAVHWEAKKVIPIPLEDMILDWKKIVTAGQDEEKDNIKILLTGAPRALVKKYIEIFKKARINLLSLETETFSLVRSLLGHDQSTIMIVEIGTNATDISVIDKSIPMLNRSIDVGGMTITKAISGNLNIGSERAEQFKYDLGIGSPDASQDVIPKTIIETLTPIINEIKYVINLYQSKNENKVEKVVLSGGSSMLTNFPAYLARTLDLNVMIGDPWSRVSYPVELKPVLDEIGPRLSVAIGLSMREME
jgi:type IV pilus assembly protein PilM